MEQANLQLANIRASTSTAADAGTTAAQALTAATSEVSSATVAETAAKQNLASVNSDGTAKLAEFDEVRFMSQSTHAVAPLQDPARKVLEGLADTKTMLEPCTNVIPIVMQVIASLKETETAKLGLKSAAQSDLQAAKDAQAGAADAAAAAQAVTEAQGLFTERSTEATTATSAVEAKENEKAE